MRCPPGLVFDDAYQRCEWPNAGSQMLHQRLGSLRDIKSDDTKNSTKSNLKKLRVTTPIKQSNKTLPPGSLSPSTTVSPTNQTKSLKQ